MAARKPRAGGMVDAEATSDAERPQLAPGRGPVRGEDAVEVRRHGDGEVSYADVNRAPGMASMVPSDDGAGGSTARPT